MKPSLRPNHHPRARHCARVLSLPRLLSTLAVLAAIAPLALHAGPWEPLFNGHDLSGWKQIAGSATYEVADGCIVGTTVNNSPNSFLATERPYGDFILEMEVMQDAEQAKNGGVQFRSELRPAQNGRPPLVFGYQFEIDPAPRAWTGGIYDEARRGWLYTGDMNPRGATLYRTGQWNRLRIEAIGPSLRTWVNGVPVANVADNLTPAGFIALQVHSVSKTDPAAAGRKTRWRDIRIQTRDLAPSPDDASVFQRNMLPNDLSPAERAAGWRLLWDGKTAAGWRGARKTAFPAAGWKIENGELIVNESGGAESKNGGDIVTEAEFSAFELQLEFKFTPGANSGVKYFVVEKLDSIGGGGSAIGLEYQILDDKKHPDAKLGRDGNRCLAGLYDLIAPDTSRVKGVGVIPKPGAWQHARIVVRPDGHVEHWLNGVRTVAYERGSAEFNALVAISKYKNTPGFGLAPQGRILLQDHGNEVRFRSIKIRELK
ncbi:MAG: DUF1080 domain-containing protein [Opitutaceae bacterium]|jgi:hypothetical protein|nr:DUF1080 domain-containing protein [Opitutaceae bacterium]